MTTIRIPRPDIDHEEVIKALRRGLGSRYHMLPEMRTTWSGTPIPADPDSIIVGTGTDRVFRAQLRIVRGQRETEIRVQPGGLMSIRLINTLGIARKVSKALAEGLGA